MKLENIIYCGDNLTWLKKFPDKCIDLIYIDPPFFSNKHYEIIFHDGAEIRSFEDRWKGGINHYIEWMKNRVFEMHRILKDTGSFYLHCDWHASHYLKVMCDDIFGYNNFRNEIAWCYRKWSIGTKKFVSNHDVILFYSKLDNNTFNIQYIPLSNGTIKRWKGKKQVSIYDETGRRLASSEVNESLGSPMPDWWEISIINPAAIERLGYPTQKPEALMERIIKASSNKDDLVLDPFCGCGTTIAVAQRLQRRWIGIDVSPSACKLMKNRVEKNGARGVEIIGLPINIDDLKSLSANDFQNWCVGALDGTVSTKKSGDMGIDGYVFMTRYPIQVKQSENVGRNVVDNFETAIRRVSRDMGYIIAFSFGKGAYEEVARVKKNGLHIELLTVDELLGYEEPTRKGELF